MSRHSRSEPPGIVSLPHDILVDDELRETVLRRTALVYLHQDFGALVRKVREMVEARPGVFFPWVSPEQILAEDLERMLEDLMPGYDEAMVHIDVTHRRPVQVARDLIDQFALWDDSQPPAS